MEKVKTNEDCITEVDYYTFLIVSRYVLNIRPPRGESAELEHYWGYTLGVRKLIHGAFKTANQMGYPYFLILRKGKAIIENRAPVTWRYRIRRFIRECFRSRPRQREWD